MSRRRTSGAPLRTRTPEPVLPAGLPDREPILPEDLPSVEEEPQAEPPPRQPERPASISPADWARMSPSFRAHLVVRHTAPAPVEARAATAPPEPPGPILAEVTALGEFIPVPRPEPLFGDPIDGPRFEPPPCPWVGVAPLFGPRPGRGWPRKIGRRIVWK